VGGGGGGGGGGVATQYHSFMASVLEGDEWSASRPHLFNPGSHSVGGWLGPRTDVDFYKKRKMFVADGNRSPYRPVRSVSLQSPKYKVFF